MLKSRDMVKGMIIEFTNSIGKIQLGDQYELIKAPYKGGSSALSIELLKVGSPEGTKPIKIFWVYVNGIMKVISTPQVENEAFSANELKASSNEEYLFVSNTNDKLYYRDLKQYHTPKSDDVIIGNLVFTKKSGQRKRIKNIQSLYGFLHNHSGAFNDKNWPGMHQSYKQPMSENRHFMHGFVNVEYWFENSGDLKEEFKHLELRKYNRDTRKVAEVPVDFSPYAYVLKHFEQVNVTYHYSEAVSNVLNQLMEKQKWQEDSYIVISKFDYKKYNYLEDIPKEKDVLFDLAIKTMGLKKKDCFYYNKNGFAAIAFQTQEEAEKFVSLYKDNDKIINIISKDELVRDSRINLNNMSNFYENEPITSQPSKLKM